MSVRLTPATPVAEILEKDWERTVIDLATQLGWHHRYHVFNAKRSTFGFPDWVLVRDRVVYLELKREKGVVSEQQKDWLRAFQAAGAEAYVCRPSQLQPLAEVLSSRVRVDGALWAATVEELG